MKKNLIFIFFLFIGSIMFGQITKDSLVDNYIYPNYYNSFSIEETWGIHKEAYLKQLGAKGLTVDEIEKKMAIYEKQKEEFIAQILEQRRLADIQREKADEQRKIADIQRDKADEQRKEADVLRLKADEQRKLADIQREKANEQRKQADALRKQAEDDRNQNMIQKQKAEEHRKDADILRQKAEEQRTEADILRAKANELRKLADMQSVKADELRKKAEEWRNGFEDILTEFIILSNEPVSIKPIIFRVNKKTFLRFTINGKISSGSTLIEIFNPKGEKEGELSLEHKIKSDLTEENKFFKSTSGLLNKTVSDSEIGDWKIKFSAKNSKGTVSISVAQYKT